MTHTIEIPDETYERLQALAQVQGLTLPAMLDHLLDREVVEHGRKSASRNPGANST